MNGPTIRELYDLRGQIAVITGRARNLGFDMALSVAEAGADVAISAAHSTARRLQRIAEHTRRSVVRFACNSRGGTAVCCQPARQLESGLTKS